MNIRFQTCLFAAASLCGLVVPPLSGAQESGAESQVAQGRAPEHRGKRDHRYRLIDLGTFGGPVSTVPDLNHIMNRRGDVVGGADTALADPYAPNCFAPTCVVRHTFRWHEGVNRDLGALPGTNSSFPTGINAWGLVVGYSQNGLIDPFTGSPELRAVMWQDRRIIALATFGGHEGFATGVNDRGQVVGVATNAIVDPFSFLGGTQTRAFVWENGVLDDLGTLGGPDSFAEIVNNRGQVAGESLTSATPNADTRTPTIDPFIWENGAMRDLGSLGGTVGHASNINERGQIVGYSNLAGDRTFHPFMWDRGVLTDLGTFGGSNGQATWINDAGEVVGEADFPGDELHDAFLWKNGVLTDLGNLGRTSFAFAVNSRGQVVGSSRIDPTTPHAFLWENGGPMIDLNTRIPSGSLLQLQSAVAINDRGEIAGYGALPNGDMHAFILMPCKSDEGGGCDDTHYAAGVAIMHVKSSVTETTRASSMGTRSPVW